MTPAARAITAPAARGAADVAALAEALVDAGIGVEDLGLRQPTLDDAFLTLTGRAAEADAPSLDVQEAVR